MIRFYYRAGSPATQNALLNAIRADLHAGGEVLLLVPEQQTVAVERRMLAALPPTAQLHFEVINFSRLANRVFRVLGGHCWNVATPAVKALTMWRTLQDLAPVLVQYGTHAAQPRLCEMMLQTAERCRAYRITADELLRVADDLPDGDPLQGKLRDLGTVIGVFERELCASFDNGDEELDRLEALLLEHGKTLFANTHVYVDSFTDFTAQELAVLRALIDCAARVNVTFPLHSPHHEGLHLASASHTHKQLTRMARELYREIHIVRADTPTPATAREYLAEHLFDMTAQGAPLHLFEQCDVSLCACANPFSQADAAVAEIQRLVRNGCRYRDIAVVLRDATQSIGILDAALEREGIPFFLAEKTDITVRPLVKLILLALRIHLHDWRYEDVVAYLKTGLSGVDADDINALEEYAAVWSLRGVRAFAAPFTNNPDGYVTKKSERAAAILAGANRARAQLFPPLFALFDALQKAENATQMCRALCDFLGALGVAQHLKSEAEARLAAGERREAEELSRLYTVTVEALEAISAAIGETPISIQQLLESLRLVFARTDIGTIPTSADEVTVGSASMLRTDHPRFVLVLGLNEGEFPRAVSDDGLISDAEGERLAEHGLTLPSGRAERASDELFYIYRAFCAPCEGLALFYTKSTADGRSCTPSIAVERVLSLLPRLQTRSFEATAPIDSIFSPDAALDRLCELPQAQSAALRELLAQYRPAVLANLDVPVTDTGATVTQKTADALFAKAHMSPSQLERFSQCRFAYYCDKILRLREEKAGALNLADTGTFLHYILEQVMLAVKHEQRAFADWSEPEREALVKKICEVYRADLVQGGAPLTPRAEALMDRIAALARLVITGLFEELSDSDFIPAFTEFDLEKAGRSPLLPLSSGRRVALSGKADRLDIWTSPENETYLRVVDYKTGARKFSPEDIKNGYSLQMPLYLKTLCDRAYPLLNHELGLAPDTVLRPAGVTYFSSAVKSENTDSAQGEQEALQAAVKRLTRSGVLLDEPAVLAAASHSANAAIVGSAKSKKTLDAIGFEEMFRDLDTTISSLCTEMQAGRATARPNQYGDHDPCKYCAYTAVCRAAQVKEEGEDA